MEMAPIYSSIVKIIILRFLTPEVSPSNSPGATPGRWRPTTGTTPEGLTSI